MNEKLETLVATTHTPFTSDGELNLTAIDKQAAHLLGDDVTTVFIGGTTGECHSLTVEERLALAKRWSEVARGSQLRIVVHVGANCLADSRSLAAQAESLGVYAIAAFAPSYFKPQSLDSLIACCADVASAAPATRFYYYDIPTMTGVRFSMPDFLETAAEQIPTLAGMKFTNADLVAYQKCLQVKQGRFDMPWGVDECLLPALIVGAKGAVGSTYNFAAKIYQRLWKDFSRGDLAAARKEQLRSIQLIDLLAEFGYMAAAKAMMEFLGVEVGPPRLPNSQLSLASQSQLREALERLGAFDWVK